MTPRVTGGTFVIHRRAVKRAPRPVRGLLAKRHTLWSWVGAMVRRPAVQGPARGVQPEASQSARRRQDGFKPESLDQVRGRVPDVDPRRTVRDRRRVSGERHLLPRLLGLALPIP